MLEVRHPPPQLVELQRLGALSRRARSLTR